MNELYLYDEVKLKIQIQFTPMVLKINNSCNKKICKIKINNIKSYVDWKIKWCESLLKHKVAN